jgi:GNAT superfamily N-acetyltransferase
MTLSLRPATAADADAIAALFRASRALLTFMPELHTAAEDRDYVGTLILTQRVTIAEQDGRLAGFMAEEDGWITQLYMAPDALRAGGGSALLADAKSRNDRLELWCFLDNHRARAFYEKHGFAAAEVTDGSSNEARLPDIRYRWTR